MDQRSPLSYSSRLFDRPSGPIAYSVPLFHQVVERHQFAQQLPTNSLSWYWESQRTADPSPESASLLLPEHRPITRVDSGTVPDLVADLIETNVDGYNRFLALFGTEDLLGPHEWPKAIRQLLDGAPRPLVIAVVQLGDSADELVFVGQPPSKYASELLDEWGVLKGVRSTKPYTDLGTAMLERLYPALE
jgi:hypothetical protein